MVSEFVELVDQVKQKNIPLAQATQLIEQIMAKKPRFNPAMVIIGYFLSCIGLTMLYRPELRSLLVTGAAGILVGLMVLWFEKQPRYNLLLPVLPNCCVDLVFNLTRGFIFGRQSAHYSPDPFLPGALLTTGMIDSPRCTSQALPADLWRGSASAVVHRDCSRIEPLGVGKL
jgi:uncharacterized membrane protein YjjP (DUF1212 family)